MAKNKAIDENKVDGPWTIIFKKFKKNKLGMFGLFLYFTMLILVLLAPYLTPYDPETLDPIIKNSAPSAQHWLGTDALGRDYLTRILYGGRISMSVGFFSVGTSLIIGVTVGGFAGYYGGKVDIFLMRFSEIVSSIPTIPLIITMYAIVGTNIEPKFRIYLTMVLIGLLSWTGMAKTVRAQILTLREQEFMVAATALGLSDRYKIYKYLVPNVAGFIIINVTFAMAGAIMLESSLSFLGLGVVPPTASWGSMIQVGRDTFVLKNRPWLWISPSVCIFLVVLGINMMGDALRDAIDPRS